MSIINEEIVYLSRFIYEQAKLLSLNLPLSKIEKEIKNLKIFQVIIQKQMSK